MAIGRDTPVVLISGANQGIGLATARRLATEHNYRVIIGSRNAAAGKQAADSISPPGNPVSSVQLDIDSDESINAAVEAIAANYGRLDVLINNAAILLEVDPKTVLTRELMNRTLQVNVTGQVCLTEAFLPLLRKSSLPRIIFVSSEAGSMKSSQNREWEHYEMDGRAYRASKAAVNMLMVQYARLMEDEGALVNAVCPGLIQTKLNNYQTGGLTTDIGAQRILELATAEKGGVTGTFSNRGGPLGW